MHVACVFYDLESWAFMIFSSQSELNEQRKHLEYFEIKSSWCFVTKKMNLDVNNLWNKIKTFILSGTSTPETPYFPCRKIV